MKTSLHSTPTVQLQRCVIKDLGEKKNNILLHVMNTIKKKTKLWCPCPICPGTRDIAVCLKYWMAN